METSYKFGDKVIMKKPHACQTNEWIITRIGVVSTVSYVVNDYQTTPQIEEALYRQVEIYTILGLKEEASRVLKVMAHNYSQSEWYNRAVDIRK